jgi:hypothetical protein
MRKGFLSVLVGLWLAFPAFAQSPPALAPGDAAAIRATIERQIEAFRADDAVRAFALADANIQSMFGSPERFMAMVRAGYAAIYRPRNHAFGDGRVVFHGQTKRRQLPHRGRRTPASQTSGRVSGACIAHGSTA